MISGLVGSLNFSKIIKKKKTPFHNFESLPVVGKNVADVQEVLFTEKHGSD